MPATDPATRRRPRLAQPPRRRGGRGGDPPWFAPAPLPVVPQFQAGSVPTASLLNQLAYAVSFALSPPKAILAQVNAAPFSGGQSISATTATAIGWNSVTDSNGGWTGANNTRYTVQTPGYYLADGTWESTAETTSGYRGAFFRVTTGPGNPGGPGVQTSYGASRAANVTSATGVNYTSVGCSVLLPYMYAGDYVELIAYSSHSETVGFTDGGSMMSVVLASI